MIEKQYDKFILVCDVCGKEIECDSFNEAIEYKEERDWNAVKIKGEWFDVCSICKDIK